MSWIWQSAAQTHRGKKRSTNQDAVLDLPEQGLWVVADGMGGHHAGELASACVRDTLAELRLSGTLAERVDRVEDGLLLANARLRTQARAMFDGETIGTTVVALIACGDVAAALWAGDSRLYRLRGSSLEQITRDHNPISDMLDSGRVTEAQALDAETNVITRAVGGQSALHLDVVVFDVELRDTLLLCSDGLYREVEPSTIVGELNGAEVTDVPDRLLAHCLETQARDNVSMVVVRPLEG